MSKGQATKEQLYAVATDAGMNLDTRYEAARELQHRQFKPEHMMLDFVRLYPRCSPSDLGERFGVPPMTIENMARRLGLKRAVEG